jgi:hypothetical protein
MRRIMVLLSVALLAAVVVSCGGADTPTSIGDVESCSELEDFAVSEMQGLLDSIDDWSVEQVNEAVSAGGAEGAGAEAPSEWREFTASNEDIAQKATSLGCDLDGPTCERMDELDAKGSGAEYLLLTLGEAC